MLLSEFFIGINGRTEIFKHPVVKYTPTYNEKIYDFQN